MAAKYVVLKCEDADGSLAAIKKDGVVKAMDKKIVAMINNSSGGKLTTQNKSPDGYMVICKVVSLKPNDPKNITKLTGKISLVASPTGAMTQGFSGDGNGSVDGASLKTIQKDAEELVSDLFEDLLKKWFAKV